MTVERCDWWVMTVERCDWWAMTVFRCDWWATTAEISHWWAMTTARCDCGELQPLVSCDYDEMWLWWAATAELSHQWAMTVLRCDWWTTNLFKGQSGQGIVVQFLGHCSHLVPHCHLTGINFHCLINKRNQNIILLKGWTILSTAHG